MFEKYYSILQNDEEDKIKINKKGLKGFFS